MPITLYRPLEEKYSSLAWNIRLALAEKKLSYKTVFVSISKNEHKSQQILKLNPKGTLPIFQDDDVILSDTETILHYLEHYYPKNRLLPNTTDKKLFSEAIILYYEVMHVFENAVQPLLHLLLQTNVNTVSKSNSCCNLTSSTEDSSNEELDLGQLYALKQKVVQEVLRWEKLLIAHKGQFLIGDSVTLADVVFFPLLAHLYRYGLPLATQFPKLYSYFQRMNKRTSVKQTLPHGWKSAVNQWLK